MQDNPSPSALAIRRATRVRELNRMKRTELWPLLSRASRNSTVPHRLDQFRELGPQRNRESIINEILRLEGLDMAVLS